MTLEELFDPKNFRENEPLSLRHFNFAMNTAKDLVRQHSDIKYTSKKEFKEEVQKRFFTILHETFQLESNDKQQFHTWANMYITSAISEAAETKNFY